MTRRACVMGHPVAHSRSPLIHGYWLGQHGINGAYERRDVAPEDFPDFLARLADEGYVGGNVTVPLKEIAFRTVAVRDAPAEAIGAVNTLWFEDGRLVGGNTDAAGFIAHLDASVPGWEGEARRALILGAGGAGRAALYALRGRRIACTVANRTRARAEELGDRFGAEVIGWDVLPGALAQADLLVNTTTLGMSGQPPLDLDLAPIAAHGIVYDIVYVPLETALLRAARTRALRTVDGLGMLLQQAVPGFARWFGVTPAVTAELRALAAADLPARDGR